MTTKIAFMGFRHGHIWDVHGRADKRDDTEIVACCEEHEETRAKIKAGGGETITHDSFARMLDEVDCDVVAVGDYYGRRGALVIEALKRGKHVISDKPLCTSLDELAEIRRLAGEGGRVVGCQFDLRDSPKFMRLRDLVQNGEIGDVQAASFNGQHPLMYGTRADWYFEEGKHGGTINDIAIHAIDALPWITGCRFTTVNAARNWNACLKQVPHFRDGAQMMLTMDNGAGVLGDVSYFAPDSFGYSFPYYWQVILWGAGGVLSCSSAEPVRLFKAGEKEARVVDPGDGLPGGYLEAFLSEIRGQTEGLHLSSAEVMESARVTLSIQNAADEGLANVAL